MPAETTAAARATGIAFAASGVAFASWVSRIPQVRDRLDLTPARLGLVLLAIAAGSILALPAAGGIVKRFGSGRTVAGMSVLLAGGLAIIAVGHRIGVGPLVAGLFVFGFANGAWDVAMNVQGALVEQHLGRSIMSRFHAGFSIGTVAGALLGALMVALHVPVVVHLLLVAAAVAAIVPVAVRRFVADEHAPLTTAEHEAAVAAGETGPETVLAAWREPRTVLVGLFVLAFAFAEGAGNDWISVALIDGYDVPDAVGTLGFAAFLAAMTTGRWFGPGLLDRHGRVVVVRALAGVGIVGVLVFVFGPTPPVAFAGALLWGVGVSLGFPVGMSAGADEPRFAPVRVSVIASIGYCAFLAGPPLIGLLGNRDTVLHALTAVAVMLAVAVLLASVTRPIRPTG